MARGKNFWQRVKGCQIGSLSLVVMQKVVSFLIPYCLAFYFKVRLTKTWNAINCSVIAFSFLVHDIELPFSIFFSGNHIHNDFRINVELGAWLLSLVVDLCIIGSYWLTRVIRRLLIMKFFSWLPSLNTYSWFYNASD